VPIPGTAAAIAANPHGAEVYARNCSICHGDQAGGIQPGFPSLIGVGQRLTPEQVAATVVQGKGRMPGFHKLVSGDMTDLMRYLGAAPVDPNAEKKEAAAASGAVESAYRFTGYRRWVDQDGYPAVAPPWGTLSAIDLNTGKYLWKIPFGEYPELKAKGVPVTGTENYGGPVVTAGGLVFIGATIFDRQFHAYDAKTGELLWHTELPYGGLATPATYMVDGKQYVVIGSGGGKDAKHPLGGVYTAFALP
jgi:quinoprotein glucose dehydrogenase